MKRDEHIRRLSDPFDVLVIGGGASGLGTAVEAAARGYRTALLEAGDFAHATSSRTTKLVHGGVRYLAQGNLGLVRTALRERGRLRRNAPHLVRDLQFVVPAYRFWSGPYYGTGLKLYDILAGKQRLGKTRSLSREAVTERLPNLQPEHLRGGIVYLDGQFDDARLAMTLALTADDLGATVVNYMPVTRLLKSDGRLKGAIARDKESNREFEIAAKVVINATGVFTDEVRRMDEPDAEPIVSPSQGIHLVLPLHFLGSASALMVPKTDDGRVLFLIPWHGRALFGTTDTPVAGISNHPQPLEEEIEFLLSHGRRYLRNAPTRDDVLSLFVGLRPLVKIPKAGKSTKSLARDHVVHVSSAGLVTVVGGKWTTYRRMGEDTIDKAESVARFDARPTRTIDMKLHGAPPDLPEATLGSADEALSFYGTDVEGLTSLTKENPSLGKHLHPRLPYIEAEVVWSARHEMARTVEDVLSRRTRAMILDQAAARECAPRVAELLAGELNQGEEWKANQLHQLEKSFHRL